MVSRLTGIFRRQDKEPDCEEVRSLSSDYIDEELDEPTKKRVGSHLSKCGPCDAFMRTLRATVNLLRATPKRDAPDGFRERVRKAIREESPS